MHQLTKALLKQGWRSKAVKFPTRVSSREGGSLLHSRPVSSTSRHPSRQFKGGEELFQKDSASSPIGASLGWRVGGSFWSSRAAGIHSGAATSGLPPHQLRQRAEPETSTTGWDVGQQSPEGSQRQRDSRSSKTQLQDRAGATAPNEFQSDPEDEVHSREAAVGASGIQLEGSAGTGTPDPAVFGEHKTQEGNSEHHEAESSQDSDNGNPRTKRENLGAIRQERASSDLEVMRSRRSPKDAARGSRLGGDDSDYPLPKEATPYSSLDEPPSPQPKPEGSAHSREMPQMVLDRDGTSVWVLGTRVTVKVTGEETGSEYALLEYHLSPGDGSESHTHTKEDETWYMLEGEMEWKVGGSPFKATKGAYLHLPKGIPHSYHNSSTKPAHMLVHCMPAGLEKYFLEVGEPASGDPSAKKPAVKEQDSAKSSHAGLKYGITYHPAQVADSGLSS